MSGLALRKWIRMASGPASTPDWEIREGETFAEAVNGRLICRFPETTSKTAELVSADSKLISQLPDMLQFVELMARMTTDDEMDSQSGHESCPALSRLIGQARSLLAKIGGAQ